MYISIRFYNSINLKYYIPNIIKQNILKPLKQNNQHLSIFVLFIEK